MNSPYRGPSRGPNIPEVRLDDVLAGNPIARVVSPQRDRAGMFESHSASAISPNNRLAAPTPNPNLGAFGDFSRDNSPKSLIRSREFSRIKEALGVEFKKID